MFCSVHENQPYLGGRQRQMFLCESVTNGDRGELNLNISRCWLCISCVMTLRRQPGQATNDRRSSDGTRRVSRCVREGAGEGIEINMRSDQWAEIERKLGREEIKLGVRQNNQRQKEGICDIKPVKEMINNGPWMFLFAEIEIKHADKITFYH